MRRRQPAVHGIHTGLGAEAQDGDEDDHEENALMAGQGRPVNKPPVDKLGAFPGVEIGKEHAEQAHQGTRDGIKQVL